MPLKILLTDNVSALGCALEYELTREQLNIALPTAKDVVWQDAVSVLAYMSQLKPALVINCLGWDDSPSTAQQELLLIAARHLAQACAQLDIPLIHFSSYRVFSSDTKSIHSEKDEPVPTTPAGHAFFAAEQELAQWHKKAVCLRLSWVMDSFGDNHLTRLLQHVVTDNSTAESFSVNGRLRGAPTALSDAARVAVAIAQQILCGAENWGVMHYCSGESCTEAEFAAQVVQTLQQLQELEHEIVLRISDNLPDTEPVSAVLICRRVRDFFGVQARAWRPVLLPMIKQWLQVQNSAQEPNKHN